MLHAILHVGVHSEFSQQITILRCPFSHTKLSDAYVFIFLFFNFFFSSDKTIRGGRGRGPAAAKAQMSTLSCAWMTTAPPANSTGLNIPTSLQICKYVDLEGCPLLLRPCSTFWRGAKTEEKRGEKTAPALHIRACFGLQHQLLITFFLPLRGCRAGLGNASRRRAPGPATLGSQQHVRTKRRDVESSVPDLDASALGRARGSSRWH